MNGFEFRGGSRKRSGVIGVAPLIMILAVLAGAAIAIVVAVRAAGPAPKAVASGTGNAKPPSQNPLRSADTPQVGSPAKTQPEQSTAAPPATIPPGDTHKAGDTPVAGLPPAAAAGEHPLDPAISLAQKLLENLHKNVKDYTCIIVKQERSGSDPGVPEFMAAKIRQAPLSVYLNFLKPDDIRGREVLFVSGANDGKLSVREGSGWKHSLGVISLLPTGPIAMAGNRYPITDLGLTHLTERLLEIARQDRRYGEVEVHFFKDSKVNGRACTLVEVVHPTERRTFLFYKAQIYIDDELNVPIRYAAYMWPKKPGDEPPLDECYTYLNLKLNVGLTDADFNVKNPTYHFVDK